MALRFKECTYFHEKCIDTIKRALSFQNRKFCIQNLNLIFPLVAIFELAILVAKLIEFLFVIILKKVIKIYFKRKAIFVSFAGNICVKIIRYYPFISVLYMFKANSFKCLWEYVLFSLLLGKLLYFSSQFTIN